MAVRDKTPFKANEIYFITFTILNWEKVFNDDQKCELVYKWFRYMEKHYNNKIHGYVIMPNHIHLLLYISALSPRLSTLIFNAKRFLAYGLHCLFEPRYDSLIIQSRKFFLEKLNYIHRNPCRERWQLVDRPEDYRYSSASNYISGKGVYGVDVIDFN